MTRADIELMLQELAATTRYLQETSRRIREAAEHIVAVDDYLQAMGARVEAAITAGLSHLHGEPDDAQ